MGFYSKIGNIQAVLWCSIGSSLLGLILMILGAIVTGVAYTEITPPDNDEIYQRYKGAHFMRITGPLCLGFGMVMLFGSCCFFLAAFISERNAEYSGRSSNYRYNSPKNVNDLADDDA